MANEKPAFRFEEDTNIQEVLDYIGSTYDQHYVGGNDLQTVDVWEMMNIAQEMCQGTAVKYLARFGKKEGLNRKDLLKCAHYVILLMHFAGKEDS